MAQEPLAQVLRHLPIPKDPDLLVGIDTSDDAGVYRLSDDCAVVSTLDFFPPIVDDPFTFGRIAAANALSDVYAMGGKPRLALNIVCFPKELPLSVLHEIMSGSLDKLKEADVLLVGGHTVEDTTVKYGLSVTGFVRPGRMITNAGARPGDALILTKPLGTGIIASALKAERIAYEDAEAAITSMERLNKAAAETMIEALASACTDITGFGLIGHTMEVAKASNVNIVLLSEAVPVFPGALKLAEKKANRPRTISQNMGFLRPDVMTGKIAPAMETLLYDPQTSGGLLISIAGDRLERLLELLRAQGINGAIVGHCVEREGAWRIKVE
ncbi:MAG: selenide, water dikinase SelD [Deltaproteobacteria bacterium]|nr:selenide, water dikinase SelD [Deltaproteobacteria bacterium]